MDNATKKTIEEEIEKLAIMVAKGFETTATKEEVNDLHTGMNELREEMNELREEMNELREEMNEHFDKVEASVDKIYQEVDGFRDHMRVLTTRVDKLEVSCT